MNWKIGGIAIFIAFGLILPAGAQEKKGEPVKKIEPAKAPEPAKKVEPAKPTEAAKPAEPAKKVEPTKPAEPAKAAEPAKGPVAGQPITPTKEEAKPVVPVKEAAVVVTGTAVDVGKTSIKVKDLSGKEVEYAITAKTVVKKDKEIKKPADIKKGDLIEVTVKGKEAESISLVVPPPVIQPVVIVGNVEDVNVKAKTLKVREATGKVNSFTLTDKTVIKCGDAIKKPEDIKRGDRVEVTTRGGVLETIALPVPEIPTKVKGVVDDIDLKAKIIKVKDDKGMVLSFEVPDKTDIKLGTVSKKIVDIEKGDTADVLAKGKVAQSIVYESLSAIAGKEIQSASQEVESAKKAGAETIASELFEESVGLLKKAQEELKQKKYDWAVKDAKDSKQKAAQAAQMTISILNELKK